MTARRYERADRAGATRAVRSESFAAQLAASGPVGRLIAGHDWASTQFGAIEHWAYPLRSALGICVASRFPIVLFWGPQLRLLYNDAYLPMLGAKHPASLGQSGEECWGEVWPVIGTMLAGVLERGEATWSEDLLLGLTRRGFEEEAYFTFSYSPIRDKAGAVRGVFCAVAETTAKVLGERRWRLLRDLAQAMLGAKTAAEALDAGLDALAADPGDLPEVAAYVRSGDGPGRGMLGRIGGSTGSAGDGAPARLEDAVSAVIDMPPGGATTLEVALDDGLSGPGLGPDSGSPVPGRAIVALLGALSADERVAIAIRLSPRLVADEGYLSFLSQVAAQLTAGMAEARAGEAARERADAQAALDRSKMAFFANMSHEFRTPLTLMLAPLREALTGRDRHRLDESQREWMELAHRNGQRLSRLVDALLDFSRAEAGNLPAELEPVDLAAATAELAAMFRSAIESGGVELTVECPPLPFTVQVDPAMWEQIVSNLVSNAFKHTFDGHIAVRVHALGERVRLEVSDTGAGIPAEELPKLFDRFHRVEGAPSRSHEGSGIGLALVRQLVELHGGSVAVTSELGKGSTFSVEIPFPAPPRPHGGEVPPPVRSAPAGPHLDALASEMKQWVGEAPSPRPLPERPGPDDGVAATGHVEGRVLVVEDNADMRRYLRRILAERYEVAVAATAGEALRAARQFGPDLVLSDVMLPGTSGLELVGQLRESPGLEDVPVVLLSARAGPESAVEALEVGAADYLVKPFTAEELASRVRSHLIAGSERRQRRVLAGVAAALLGTRSEEQVVAALHREVSKLLGNDHSHLAVLDDDSGLVHLWHEPPLQGAISERYRSLDPASPTPLVGALREGRRLVIEDRSDLERRFGHVVADFEAMDLHALVAAPLPGIAGEGVGALSFSWRSGRPLRPGELAFVDAASEVVVQAVERVRRAARERRLGEQIQSRLLEIHAGTTAAVLAARYRPADPVMVVGGDWYDAFDLDDGSLAVTVGDVIGSGFEAAILMGQLRSAIGAAAATEREPHRVLDVVDAYSRRLPGALCSTATYLVLDPSGRSMRWCCAGHPPPLVIDPEGGVELPMAGRRVPLGVADSAVRSRSGHMSLAPGAVVLLYTDGLVERRDESLDDGFARLVAVAEECRGLPVSELCDAVLEAMAPAGGYSDDVAVIALRTTGAGVTSYVDAYPATPAALTAARTRLRGFIGSCQLPEDAAEDVLLAVGEASANAVQHGSRPGHTGIVGVEMLVAGGVVSAAVSDGGAWSRDTSRSAREDRGRGFQIMQSLMDDVTVRRSAIGTSVVLTRRIARERPAR